MRPFTILTTILILVQMAAAETVIFEPNDATDVSVYFRAYDKTTGEPNLTPVVTDYTPCFVITGAAMVVPDSNLTALATAATAHTNDKAIHVGQGLVRWDVNDTPFSGSPGVRVMLMLVDDTGEDRFQPPFMIVELYQSDTYTMMFTNGPGDSNDVAEAILVTPGQKLVTDAAGNVTLANGAHGGAAATLTLQTPVQANLAGIKTTALPAESQAGRDAAAFGKLLDVATPVLTAASVNQTGDAYVPATSAAAYGVFNSGLMYRVTVGPDAHTRTAFHAPIMVGMGAGAFVPVPTNTYPWKAYVFRTVGGTGAAPQGEQVDISAFNNATGVFTLAGTGFTTDVSEGDAIFIEHPGIAQTLALANVQADTTAILADTSAMDTANELRTLLTGGTTAVSTITLADLTGTSGVWSVDWSDYENDVGTMGWLMQFLWPQVVVDPD